MTSEKTPFQEDILILYLMLLKYKFNSRVDRNILLSEKEFDEENRELIMNILLNNSYPLALISGVEKFYITDTI